MPLYDYQCDSYGAFSAWRSMREAGQPVSCPLCQNAAPRVITAPYVSTMSPSGRALQERNERSAHAPQVIQRPPQAGHTEHAGTGATRLAQRSRLRVTGL